MRAPSLLDDPPTSRPMLEFTSPAFDHGARIPRDYGYTERNVNPELRISGSPADATSLALIVDDPDAVEPAGKIWDHWVVWNIDPDRDHIPEGWEPTTAEEGRNDFGETGYGGPNPPDREHTYRFELYALDDDLDLASSATATDVRDAAEGHVLDDARLEGTYAP